MDCQFIPIYGKFVKSQTTSFSRADINYNVPSPFYKLKLTKVPVSAQSYNIELY